MPYLEVQKQQIEENLESIEMPNATGLELQEAKKILQELGLEIEVNGEGDMVIDQLPKKGIQINTGTKVVVYVQ